MFRWLWDNKLDGVRITNTYYKISITKHVDKIVLLRTNSSNAYAIQSLYCKGIESNFTWDLMDASVVITQELLVRISAY